MVIGERTGQLQELRRQLSEREQELHELRWDKERETGGEVEHLRTLLKEKEAFIKVPAPTFSLCFFSCYISFTPDLHRLLYHSVRS